MSAPTRIYAEHAANYTSAGLPVFPVDTRQKRPVVKGWQAANPRRSLMWAGIEKLGGADGLGIVMGKPSGLSEIDVDAAGDAWVAAAVERFGETPITIRTASGKAKLWYRSNGEGRRIRPFPGQPIDILGDGYTIAPPSWREDLGASYAFSSGGLADIADLPTIPPEVLDTPPARMIMDGQRNNNLWRWAMTQARHCDDVEALIDVAATWNAAFPDPLTIAEVDRCARSAWRYETTGRNFFGLKRPQVTEGDVVMDTLIDHPDAFMLHQLFRRWHGNRPSFAIAPTAMSAAGHPPWHRSRIERARDVLLERGYLEELAAPAKVKRKSGLYRITPEAKLSLPLPAHPRGGRVYLIVVGIRQVRRWPMPDRKNGPETGRNRDGTFAPGNPGRPRGARHKTTLAVEDLLRGEAEGLTRKAVDMALAGDTTALRLCLERIAPVRKDAPVQFGLPDMESAQDVTAAAQAVLRAVSSGQLTPLEGASIMALVEGFRRVLETEELDHRITELERLKS